MQRLITIVSLLVMSNPLHALHQAGQRPRAASATQREFSLPGEVQQVPVRFTMQECKASSSEIISPTSLAALKAGLGQLPQRRRTSSVGSCEKKEKKAEESKRPQLQQPIFCLETRLSFCRMLMSWRLKKDQIDNSSLTGRLCKDVRFATISHEDISLKPEKEAASFIQECMTAALKTHPHMVVCIPTSKFFSDKLIETIVGQAQTFFPKMQLAGNPIARRAPIKLFDNLGQKSITIIFLNAPDDKVISLFDFACFGKRLEALAHKDFLSLQRMVKDDLTENPELTDCVFGTVALEEIAQQERALRLA